MLNLLSIFSNGNFKLKLQLLEGATYPHMGGYPIHNKAFYHSRGDLILSSLINEREDGGFGAIRGSHKANFPIPYKKRSKEEWALIEHVPINIGDAIYLLK